MTSVTCGRSSKHLKLARHMIEAAGADGTRTRLSGSLGWGLYRLGNAEKQSEPSQRRWLARTPREFCLTTWGTSTTTRDALLRRSRLGEKPKIAFQQGEETDKMKVIQDKIESAVKPQNVVE